MISQSHDRRLKLMKERDEELDKLKAWYEQFKDHDCSSDKIVNMGIEIGQLREALAIARAEAKSESKWAEHYHSQLVTANEEITRLKAGIEELKQIGRDVKRDMKFVEADGILT